MILSNGIHPRFPRSDYDKVDRLNFSALKLLNKSPAHFEHAQTSRQHVDSDAMLRGRATHMACFEPERFRAECVVFEGKVRRGKEWEAFVERNPDAEILTEAIHSDAIAMSKAVLACAMAQPFISGGQGEVTLAWTHTTPAVAAIPGYSFECKGRLDFIPLKSALVDLKSTRDASPQAFGRQCAQLGYVTQAAWYHDAYRAITGEARAYYLVAVESTAPFVVQVYLVPPELLELGRQQYRALLDRLNVCRQESRWPGYADSPMALELPRWAMPDDDDNDLSGMGLEAA